MIHDGQSLVGAKSRFGSPIRTYDNGFGPLWVLQDSMGIAGIVRAQTWEEAYECCEDEIFPSVDLSDAADFEKDFGENWIEDASWNEQYGIRPNGPRETGGSCYYRKDLNGELLNPLTETLAKELEISVEISDE